MAELEPAERAQFSAIIDGILSTADLQTISAKQIRKGLSDKLGVDLSDKKKPVQDLIHERFDHASKVHDNPLPTTETANGYHTPQSSSKDKTETTPSSAAISTPLSAKSDSDSDIVDEPPKKKKKPNKKLDDAKLAAMLQAEENGRGRSTRGAGTKKVVKRKSKVKTPKKKSEKKVRGSDDSEAGSGSDVKDEKPKKGGFHKQYMLSAPLAELVGETTLSRPQVVKKIWEYIKERDLQDPADKRQIRCDERMQSVFKTDKVHMFTMNKILGKQLYDLEE